MSDFQLPPYIQKQLPEGIRHNFIEVDQNKKMHVMELGTGYPVLLLHGNPMWGFLWRKVIEYNQQKFRFIMPDLMGLGFSDSIPANQHSLENHGRWILSLIQSMSLEKILFVGQDWGGPIGLRASAEIPEIVKGIVLLNTSICPPKLPIRLTTFHRLSNMPIISDFVFRILGFPLHTLHKVQGDKSSIAGEVLQAYQYPIKNNGHGATPLALARMVPTSDLHPSYTSLQYCEKFIKAYQGPSALVWGERDPVLGRAFKRVYNLMPGAQVTKTQAGHFLQEESFVEIAAAILHVFTQIK